MKSMSGFGGGVASLSMKSAGAGGGGGIVSENLVAHWDFGDTNCWNGSSATVNDLSGNGNGGTLRDSASDFTYQSGNGGHIRTALATSNYPTSYPKIQRNGTDYFDTMGIKPFTLEFWVRPYWSSYVTPNYQFFTNSTGSPWNNNFRVGFWVNGTDMVIRGPILFGNSTSWHTFGNNSSDPFNITQGNFGDWTHVVYVRNGPPDATTAYTTEIFINGVSLGNPSTGGYGSYDDPAITGGMVLGSDSTTSTANNETYQGDIGIYRFYVDKALSLTEINQNFDVDKIRFGLGGIVTDNLVLNLDAGDSNSYSGSGTTWTDLSGQGNHATLVNNPTYSSNNGGYLNFDGSNDYATLPNMDLTGNELTFSIWTYCTTTSQSASLIFLGDSTASHGNGRIIQVHLPYAVTGGQYYFDKGYDGSSSASYDRINGSISSSDYLNQWVNWSFTANASTGSMKIYRNASLYASGTGKTKTFSNSDGDMKYIAYSGTNYYQGRISNLQLYKKELSASEVTQNFEAAKTRFGL